MTQWPDLDSSWGRLTAVRRPTPATVLTQLVGFVCQPPLALQNGTPLRQEIAWWGSLAGKSTVRSSRTTSDPLPTLVTNSPTRRHASFWPTSVP